jgi:hypothetical protein
LRNLQMRNAMNIKTAIAVTTVNGILDYPK